MPVKIERFFQALYIRFSMFRYSMPLLINPKRVLGACEITQNKRFITENVMLNYRANKN